MSALPSWHAGVPDVLPSDVRQASGPFRLVLEDLPPLATLEAMWRQQEARAPGSFFTSWTWIGTWVETLGSRCHLELMTAFDKDDQLSGMAIIARRRHWRFGAIPVLTGYLHETGLADCDGLTIEYNGLLVRDEERAAVTSAMVTTLMSGGLDQLRLSGVAHVPVMGARGLHVETAAQRAFFVDLEAITAADADYLAVLKQRSRYLIRKSIKRLAGTDTLRLDVAETPEKAEVFLDELMTLHTRYWRTKGKPGAFGSDFQRRFHKRLLATGLPRGEVVLLAVMHGDRPMGYFYYFCFAGWVHYYQSGIDYEHYQASESPGLAAHALAIEYFREAGWAVYDFMPGDQQYKRTLATRDGLLQWVKISQRSLKMRLVGALHRTARGVRKRLQELPGLKAA